MEIQASILNHWMLALVLQVNKLELHAKRLRESQDAKVTCYQPWEKMKKLIAEYFHFAQRLELEIAMLGDLLLNNTHHNIFQLLILQLFQSAMDLMVLQTSIADQALLHNLLLKVLKRVVKMNHLNIPRVTDLIFLSFLNAQE